MLLIIASIAALQNTIPNESAVRHVVERLDMSSFPNSVRARRQSGSDPRTLRQLRPQHLAWRGDELAVIEPDSSWLMRFRPLPSPRGRVRLCFTDQATNGGTYIAQNAIEVRLGAREFYRARQVGDAGCAAFAR